MKKPEISIIVPVYNVEKYLNKCVDSILNQTFKNFELILVDDGSPDNCGKICDEYVFKDSRVKVIHKENGGLSSARNAGLDVAQGEYIGFVDSDDWIEPDMYEVLYKNLKKYQSDVAIIDIKYKENKSYDKYDKEVVEIYLEKALLKDLIYNYGKNIMWSVCNKLFRRIIIKNFFKEGRIYEDGMFMYEISLNIKKAIKINKKLYNYRTENQSITRSPISIKQLDFLYNTLDIAKILPQPYKTDMLLRDLLRYTEYILLEIIKQKKYEKEKELVKAIKEFYKKNHLEIQKIKIDNDFIKLKFYILRKHPKFYLIIKKITKRY